MVCCSRCKSVRMKFAIRRLFKPNGIFLFSPIRTLDRRMKRLRNYRTNLLSSFVGRSHSVRYCSCTRCRHLRIYFPRKQSARRKNWIARVFDLLRNAVRPAVDHSLPLGPELAELKYTRQIFNLNFLGNGRSCEKTSFFLSDLFLRVEWCASGAQKLCVPRCNRILLPA